MKLFINAVFALARLILFLYLLLWAFASCCRPATEFQMQKWERRHKFESPKQFLRVSPFKKRNVYRY